MLKRSILQCIWWLQLWKGIQMLDCLHHSLNGYIFLCFSSLTCQSGNITVNWAWGFPAPYLDKLVKHTESMWDWVVKFSDYSNLNTGCRESNIWLTIIVRTKQPDLGNTSQSYILGKLLHLLLKLIQWVSAWRHIYKDVFRRFRRLTVSQFIFIFWAITKIKERGQIFFKSIDSKNLEKIFLVMMEKKNNNKTNNKPQDVFVLHITHGEYEKLLHTVILFVSICLRKKHIKQGIFYTYVSYMSQFPSINPFSTK